MGVRSGEGRARPTYEHHVTTLERRQGEGVGFEYFFSDNSKAVLSSVQPGSAADRAGLQAARGEKGGSMWAPGRGERVCEGRTRETERVEGEEGESVARVVGWQGVQRRERV